MPDHTPAQTLSDKNGVRAKSGDILHDGNKHYWHYWESDNEAWAFCCTSGYCQTMTKRYFKTLEIIGTRQTHPQHLECD